MTGLEFFHYHSIEICAPLVHSETKLFLKLKVSFRGNGDPKWVFHKVSRVTNYACGCALTYVATLSSLHFPWCLIQTTKGKVCTFYWFPFTNIGSSTLPQPPFHDNLLLVSLCLKVQTYSLFSFGFFNPLWHSRSWAVEALVLKWLSTGNHHDYLYFPEYFLSKLWWQISAPWHWSVLL